jgi:hypothetical protein
VALEDKGSFKSQRAKVIAKTSQKAGWVLRTFRTRDIFTMRTLWRSLAQPHQDYASQLLAPAGLVGDILDQEGPLRAFTRRITGLKGLSYVQRLKAANLLFVERRQERYKIIYVHKIQIGVIPNCGISVAPISDRRGGSLTVPTSARDPWTRAQSLRDRSFLVEGPRLFNSLPKSIRERRCSTNTVKLHLDRLLEDIPDHHNVTGADEYGTVDWTGRHSNSIKDWVRVLHLDDWTPRNVAVDGGGGKRTEERRS